MCVFPYTQQWYRRKPTGFEVIPDSELSNAGSSADEALVSIDTHPRGSAGAWGVTERFESLRVSVWLANGTPAEEQALRALYVDTLAAAGDPLVLAHMPSFRTQDYASTTIVWSGWVHNGVSLASLSLCVVNARRLPRRLVAWRRAKNHHCPVCDYDLRGTPGGLPCPECGTFGPQAAPPPAR